MLLRRKIRSKVILVLIIVFLFLYWRGVKSVTSSKGWDCKYHLIYAVCNAKNNKAQLPDIWDILQAGVKF